MALNIFPDTAIKYFQATKRQCVIFWYAALNSWEDIRGIVKTAGNIITTIIPLEIEIVPSARMKDVKNGWKNRLKNFCLSNISWQLLRSLKN
jgi:phytoene/squalene synthetase